MISSHAEVEQLLSQIRAQARAPEVVRLTDQVSLLCRAALTPSPGEIGGMPLKNLTSARVWVSLDHP